MTRKHLLVSVKNVFQENIKNKTNVQSNMKLAYTNFIVSFKAVKNHVVCFLLTPLPYFSSVLEYRTGSSKKHKVLGISNSHINGKCNSLFYFIHFEYHGNATTKTYFQVYCSFGSFLSTYSPNPVLHNFLRKQQWPRGYHCILQQPQEALRKTGTFVPFP